MSDYQRGTSRNYLLSRLRAENPELAKQVTLGEKSAYRAAVEAGIVTRRFSLFGDDPDQLAMTIRRNLPPEVVNALITALEAKP